MISRLFYFLTNPNWSCLDLTSQTCFYLSLNLLLSKPHYKLALTLSWHYLDFTLTFLSPYCDLELSLFCSIPDIDRLTSTKFPGQMPLRQLKSVLDVSRNLPLKFHQNPVSISWDVPDIMSSISQLFRTRFEQNFKKRFVGSTTPTLTTTTISTTIATASTTTKATFHLLLTWFWQNFNGTFLG